ncbi:hypothetical protein [Alkalicoccus halolimnae]|uniref:Uncharacterized protein n=1 Tax=Alkalicoccus halolimnae TaxID=1667239 RepID=A0A5C7F535_9BACI|nr:hypothetical protein [Alkalicoccus halolimnae]TXF85193.1 hypothetical protein FTX54_10275 [Alkalicoccus halolimnae]
MKQLIPFVVIIAIVAAVMFFLQDDYEGPFSPDYRSEASDSFWDAALYINEADEGYEVGVRLEHNDETINPDDIEALEFFVDSSNVSFFYQELELEDFDGTVNYSEMCTHCENLTQLEARVLVNWQDSEMTRSTQYQFSILLDE